MKTAGEWNWEHTKICHNDPSVHGQLLPTPKMVEFIEAIQLDACKSGMRKAAKIVASHGWHNEPQIKHILEDAETLTVKDLV